jgi:hypothetical protein
MPLDALQVLHASGRPPPTAASGGVLLIAGATGVLGNEVMRRLVGSQRHSHSLLLAREEIKTGMARVNRHLVATENIANWMLVAATTGVILFEPPRMYYGRERALWTPQPADLPALARWMAACGVRSLAVVLPHAQGRLPDALKRGLANLDEHAVAALGFERLLIVRSAAKPQPAAVSGVPQRVARWMLSTLAYMVPASEQPVRASKVAELVDVALRLMPPGIHVAAPELVWRASQKPVEGVVREWLQL